MPLDYDVQKMTKTVRLLKEDVAKLRYEVAYQDGTLSRGRRFSRFMKRRRRIDLRSVSVRACVCMCMCMCICCACACVQIHTYIFGQWLGVVIFFVFVHFFSFHLWDSNNSVDIHVVL